MLRDAGQVAVEDVLPPSSYLHAAGRDSGDSSEVTRFASHQIEMRDSSNNIFSPSVLTAFHQGVVCKLSEQSSNYYFCFECIVYNSRDEAYISYSGSRSFINVFHLLNRGKLGLGSSSASIALSCTLSSSRRLRNGILSLGSITTTGFQG